MLFTSDKDRLIARDAEEQLCIEAWGTDALRIRATRNTSLSGVNGGLMPTDTCACVTVDERGATVRNGHISARLDKRGWLEFFRDGESILKEYYRKGNLANPHAPAVGIAAREYRPLGGGDYLVRARFEGNAGEKIFGMGQYQQPELELKGCVLDLAPRNAQVSIPFYVSNRGYGFLWNNPAVGKVAFGKNYTEWESSRSAELDYWITVGDTPRDLIRNYTEVTGRAPTFPDNMLGLWQCRLRYRTQEEVLEVAREYHRRGLPLDVIIIDYFHWRNEGDWSFDPTYWPDPEAMVRELKAMGTRCMVSVWPTVEKSSVNFREIQEKGLLVRPARGELGGLFGKSFYDATNPEARALIWDKCAENYYRHGIDCFWLDVAEPEYLPADFDHYIYSVGPADKTAGLYPVAHAKAFYDGMTAAGQEDVINLLRSAWVGSQRYAAVVWSGDIRSNFETLRDQLSAGLNIGLAGIPWWTTDTGGFNGDVRDPFFNELLIRWFQFSTFCPVLRMHGDHNPHDEARLSNDRHTGGFVKSGYPHELWSYGEEVYEILKKYLLIRLEMKDYIKGLMAQASEDGSPVIRTMFYEFPQDAACWELDDQYMFGDRYLVAPVLYDGMRERAVYLPEGTWKDIHTGAVYGGGQTIMAAAPLEIIPVYERL